MKTNIPTSDAIAETGKSSTPETGGAGRGCVSGFDRRIYEQDSMTIRWDLTSARRNKLKLDQSPPV